MIKEAYVSFEVAKLLKEKGFDCPCHGTYDTAVTGGKPKFFEYEVLNYFPNGMKNSDDKYGMVISAPTYQMVMAWLREIHNIFIVIEPYTYNYVDEKISSYVASLWQGDNCCENITSKNYPTYEETVEAAIKYCLENLL